MRFSLESHSAAEYFHDYLLFVIRKKHKYEETLHCFLCTMFAVKPHAGVDKTCEQDSKKRVFFYWDLLLRNSTINGVRSFDFYIFEENLNINKQRGHSKPIHIHFYYL